MKTQKQLFFLFLVLLSAFSHAQQLPNIADPRVHIKLPTVKGDSLTLSSFKGKVILLDFWASWCGPCRVANRKLVKLYEKYKKQGFEIFSVSLDEDKKDWQRAIVKDKITWVQVIDPRGWNAQTATNWNIYQLPTSYLINKKGDVVSIDPEGKELEDSIKELLKE
ncbi:MAG: TlpA family protein disulfide reductase [Chitinophagaceae bacterium]|nr:TlpA family protein disulfide reductase [Chitinophagaceae bacterium]